jgi:hypothetical protein
MFEENRKSLAFLHIHTHTTLNGEICIIGPNVELTMREKWKRAVGDPAGLQDCKF